MFTRTMTNVHPNNGQCSPTPSARFEQNHALAQCQYTFILTSALHQKSKIKPENGSPAKPCVSFYKNRNPPLEENGWLSPPDGMSTRFSLKVNFQIKPRTHTPNSRFAPSLCQLKLSRSQAALDSWTSQATLSMKQRCYSLQDYKPKINLSFCYR